MARTHFLARTKGNHYQTYFASCGITGKNRSIYTKDPQRVDCKRCLSKIEVPTVGTEPEPVVEEIIEPEEVEPELELGDTDADPEEIFEEETEDPEEEAEDLEEEIEDPEEVEDEDDKGWF